MVNTEFLDVKARYDVPTPLEEAERLLPAMSRAEKAQLLQAVVLDLTPTCFDRSKYQRSAKHDSADRQRWFVGGKG